MSPARFTVLDERDQARDDGARQPRRAAATPRRRPDSAIGRALATAMTSAADTTFRDVVREACMSAMRFSPGSRAPARPSAAMAELSAALGVAPQDDAGSDRSRHRRRAASAARRNGRRPRRVFDLGGCQRCRSRRRGCAKRSTSRARGQIERYLSVFFTGDGGCRANRWRPRRSPRPIPSCAQHWRAKPGAARRACFSNAARSRRAIAPRRCC